MKDRILGEIKIELINNEFYRLTVNAQDSRPLDQLESVGETLSDALLNLHILIEAIE